MPPFAATHCLYPCPFDFSPPPPQLFLSNCLVQLLLFLSDPLSFLFFSLHSSFLSFLPSLLSQCFVVFLLCLAFSLRKQPTFGDATTGFPAKWRLRNERRMPILMTRHYPDLGSASDWSCRVGNLFQPIRSATQNFCASGLLMGVGHSIKVCHILANLYQKHHFICIGNSMICSDVWHKYH